MDETTLDLAALNLAALDLGRTILHRDANLLVLNKPAGIAVHRGPSGRPAIEDYLGALTFGLRHVPALAHRLDHGTSGCLVLARHPKARRRLGRLFEAGTVRKLYWAVSDRAPDASAGRIELPLAKRSALEGWSIVPDPEHGKPATTLWRVLAQSGGLTLFEVEPLDGRTHQVRVHLASIGCPLLGDISYGGTAAGRTMLHARHVEILYWADRPPVVVEAPLPPDFDLPTESSSPR